MPGNDLTALRNIIPTASTRQDQARADITTILTGIINDLEPKVTPAGLDISSALSFLSGGVYSPATDLGYVSFQNRGATSGVVGSIYEQSGELYYRDGSGNDVQITTGGALNAASLGGITGAGYGAAGRELNWDGSDYNFYDGSGTYADVRMKEVILSNDTNEVTVDVPGAITNYNLTLPGTVAAAASTLLQSDASGNCSWSNSLSTDLTFTGSAEVKHGDRVLCISHYAGLGFSSTGSINNAGYTIDGGGDMEGYYLADGAGDCITIPIPLKVGDRIKSVQFYFTASGTANRRMSLFEASYAGRTTAETDLSSYTAGNNNPTLTVSTPADGNVAAGSCFYAQFRTGSANDTISHIEVTYDRP